MQIVDITNKFPPVGKDYMAHIHYPDIITWLHDNCSNVVYRHPLNPMSFVFEDDNDALLFKLVWC